MAGGEPGLHGLPGRPLLLQPGAVLERGEKLLPAPPRRLARPRVNRARDRFRRPVPRCHRHRRRRCLVAVPPAAGGAGRGAGGDGTGTGTGQRVPGQVAVEAGLSVVQTVPVDAGEAGEVGVVLVVGGEEGERDRGAALGGRAVEEALPARAAVLLGGAAPAAGRAGGRRQLRQEPLPAPAVVTLLLAAAATPTVTRGGGGGGVGVTVAFTSSWLADSVQTTVLATAPPAAAPAAGTAAQASGDADAVQPAVPGDLVEGAGAAERALGAGAVPVRVRPLPLPLRARQRPEVRAAAVVQRHPALREARVPAGGGGGGRGGVGLVAVGVDPDPSEHVLAAGGSPAGEAAVAEVLRGAEDPRAGQLRRGGARRQLLVGPPGGGEAAAEDEAARGVLRVGVGVDAEQLGAHAAHVEVPGLGPPLRPPGVDDPEGDRGDVGLGHQQWHASAESAIHAGEPLHLLTTRTLRLVVLRD